MKNVALVLVLSVLSPVAACRADDAVLQPKDYVGVVGDSITEQKKYSVFIEDYLVMCQPAPQVTQTQFGWSGETSWGFERRMQNDFAPFKTTAATTCFGMNDGGYSPMTDEKAKHYHDAQTSIVQKMKQDGVRFIVVGSPGCVDVNTFHKHSREQAEMYNKTLAALRDIAKEVAEKEGAAFADVFDPMHEVMEKSEAKYGNDYNLAGGDGVHPDNNGHLVMAYAFLKALGCKGDIGTITVDLAGNKAEATAGHEILWAGNGDVIVESSRYPFCFYGDDPSKPGSTRGVLEFFPFNQDLNRFMLVVNNPGAEKLKITWGKDSKQFSADQLQKGINLAAEFLDNPFSEPFRQMQEKIQHKQNVETPLIKEFITHVPSVEQSAEGAKKLLDRGVSIAVQEDRELGAELAVIPVRHTIKIEAVH